MRPNAERESERLDQPTAVEVIPTGACIGAEVKNVELSCYCWALGLPSDAPRPSVPAVSVNSTGGPELPQLAQQANDSREDDFFAWMAAPRVFGSRGPVAMIGKDAARVIRWIFSSGPETTA